MLCPKCNIEAAIRDTRYVAENDDTPEKETKLFIKQSVYCRNPNCADYGKIVRTIKHQISLEKDEEQDS